MKNPLGVSPSKGYQGITRGKEKILMTSVGIEPTTSGLDLPLLCRLSYLNRPLLSLSDLGFFMGLHSTLTYTSELILCFSPFASIKAGKTVPFYSSFTEV